MELGRIDTGYMKNVTNSLLCKVVNVPDEYGGYTGFQLFKKCRIQPYTTNRGQTLYTDVHSEKQLESAFESKTVYTDTDNLVYTLQRELDVKNRQIETLSGQVSELTSALVVAQQTAAAAQALHAGTMKHLTSGTTDGDTTEEEPPLGWWARLMGRGKK